MALPSVQVTGEDMQSADVPLEIRIYTDPEARTFTIEDTGIGFTKDSLMAHLGTIARSGSKEFLSEMSEGVRHNHEPRSCW